MRFAGSDVTAGAVAGTGVEIEMPPNVIVLRASLTIITAEGGTATTFNVGTVADEDGYVANGDAQTVGTVTGAGALVGDFVSAATNIYVSQGTGTGFDGAADAVLSLEYVTVGRSTEVFG